MPGDDRLSRRTLLRRGVGAGGALVATASSGLFRAVPAGGPSTDTASTGPAVRPSSKAPQATVTDETAPLRVTLNFAGNAPEGHLERHVRPALSSFAVQAGIEAEITSVSSLSRSVDLRDDYERILDRFETWAEAGDADRRDGHVNFLLYAQSPLVGSAYACDHRGVLAADAAPMAVCNADVALFWPRTAYRNTIITALARPVLAGMVGKTLSNGEEMGTDLNAFGTVHGGDVPRSSPLATWHTPAAGGCVKPNNYEGEDIVERHCGYETTQTSCGYTTQLSECTILGSRASLADL